MAEKQTVERFLAHWLDIRRHNTKPQTWLRYEIAIRVHLLPALGRIKLSRLTAQQVEQLLAAKLDSDLSPTSVVLIHTVLRTALNHALRQGLVARNVATLVRAPRPAKTEMQVLSAEQVQALFQAAKGDRLEALYVLAVATGMRSSELLGLQWEDLHLDDAWLQVQHQIGFTKGSGWYLDTPKTKGSRRRIDLPPMAVEALRTHRTRQLEERLMMGPAWEEHGFVFPNEIGEPIRGTALLANRFRPLLKRAGLPAIRLHDLRHTAATMLLEANTPTKVVAEMLGHANVGITSDRYQHVTVSMQQQAAMTMQRLLAGN